jgi:arsenate reductase (thioredoxin)
MSEQETKQEPKTRVLFLCTGNSCRSQMAEGFLRVLAGDRFEAASAGIAPMRINPTAVRVMAEIGIDISEQRSKSVVEMMGKQFDYVVTVCDNARETCPIFPGSSKKLHWSFDDPATAEGAEEERLEVFRRVRNELVSTIREFVVDPVASMDKPSAAAGRDVSGDNPVGMTCL